MFQEKNILIVDDDDALVSIFEKLAESRDWTFDVARTGTEAIEKLGTQLFEVAIIDIKLPGYSGMQVMDYLKSNNIPSEVVIITGVGSIESAVSAIKKGAYDYLTKPFDDIEKVAILLEKAMERHRLVRKLHRLERQTLEGYAYEEIVGKSKKMQEIFNTIDSIASTSSTVLILGESGTGKELVARAIHVRSARKNMPFVVINCAAIPEYLLESELFGYKKGSFTGALADKKGLFEEAHGGTVFLDEVGEIPPSIQVKLLRVLQEGEVRPVGDVSSRQVDVRLVAATNKDLIEAVKDGRFREDLYYRLNVIVLSLPPLRDRADDIPLLAYHFLQKYSEKVGKLVDKISIDALQALQNYSWAGNVRELENVIERGVVLAEGDSVTARNLPAKLLGESFYLMGEGETTDLSNLNYQDAKDKALESFNRMYISNLLAVTGGNISFASEKAGMDRSNFKKLIKRYDIDIHRYRRREMR
jgi:two-component system response regulator HydG